MSSLTELESPTFGDILKKLGGIDPDRVLTWPRPGTATAADAFRLECELFDGTLVRKPMGFQESTLGIFIGEILNAHVRRHNLGLVTGESGFYEIFDGAVRAPDVSFVAWASLPEGKRPQEAYPGLVPDLVVEILSRGNTKSEMRRKRADYFTAGAKLIWEIDPKRQTARVFVADDEGTAVPQDGVLDGGAVVPGFAQPLADLFAELERTAPGAPETPAAP